MIDHNFSIKEEVATQQLKTTIQADRKTVFRYLATTEGISSWFPQLSIDKENDEKIIFFDMGDGTFEKMKLLDYKTDEHISYEWATGHVAFTLEEGHEGTTLTLTEELPREHKAIPEDFTGWYVQMKNVKSIAETRQVASLDRNRVLEVKEKIQLELHL